MNLFKEETQQVLEKFISKDWAEQLSQYIDIDAFETIRKTIKQKRSESVVYPESDKVFRALKDPFDNVKIVIITQDPYHNGNADGLAFSCKSILSPSWQQIMNAIIKDEFKNSRLGSIHSLEPWLSNYKANSNNWKLDYLAEQGVLLYNPTLTVEAGKPGSHKGIWTIFTDAVYKSLETKQNLIWMLWGNDARESFNKVIRTEKSSHLYLHNEHPAAAAWGKRIWECNHFTTANEWLKEHNLTEIEWIQR